MACETGTLIDLSKPPESEQECKIMVVSRSPSEASLLGETTESFILNKQLSNVQGKTAHRSPLCGVLIDLDFGGLSSNESGSAVVSVQSCENSRFFEQNNSDLTLPEKSATGSLHLKNEKSSSTSSSKNVNCSWSPSIICKDADLLENEEFDFNFMSSISPERGNTSPTENMCQRCSSQKKLPELSTPRKEWSILNDAFISEISEEAAKVVIHLSAKKVFPEQSEARTDKILSVSLNSSFSEIQPIDLDEKNQNSLLDGNDVLRYNSSKNLGDNFFLCANKNDSVIDAEYVSSKNELSSEITEVAAKSANLKNGSSEQKCKILDDCIKSDLNAVKEATNTSAAVSVENIIHAENKENIPVDEAETSVFGDCNSSDEASNSIVCIEELIAVEQLSSTPDQKFEILNSSCPPKEGSPLVRRETFTVKTNPLQEFNKSASKNKTVNNCGYGKAKIKFSTPKSTVHIKQPHSKKDDLPSHPTLIRKETYTISPGSNTKNLLATENQTVAVTNCTTPKTVNRIVSFAGKIKSLSCKMTKSKCEPSPAGRPVSSSKTPKDSSTSRTPTMPNRTSLLPSKLNYSQSFGAFHSRARVGSSVQQSSVGVTKSNSFQLKTGLVNKRHVLGNKHRSSSEGEVADSGLVKKTVPVKAIAPVNSMVKAPASQPSGTDISNICGNKGKITPSSASQGLRSGRVNTAHSSDPAKSSNCRSTPKSASTPLRPRFLSQNDSTPTPVKNNAGVRRFSFVPTPTKHFTPKRTSAKFC